MPTHGKDDRRSEESVDDVSGTRREFLGATAGAGIAGMIPGRGGDGDESLTARTDPTADAMEAALLSDHDGVFDITEYGAVGDGETDNTQAIYDAIADASEVQGTVLIPHGEFVTDWILLRRENSGITIRGLGYGSVLSPLQAVDPEACWTWGVYNDDSGEIPIDSTNFTRGIAFNDQFSPPTPFPGSLGNSSIEFNYREAAPITNVTIRDLRLDGKREAVPIDNTDDTWEMPRYDNGAPETPVDAPTGFGITLGDQETTDNIGNSVHNVWTHGWMYNGLMINQGGANVSNVVTWDNGFHGVGLGGPLEPTSSAANLTNVVAFNNGQYGIDSSYGVTNVANFSLYDNGFGMKLAGPDRLSAVNGRIVGNVHQGFQMTDPTDVAFLDNITSRDNGGGGFMCWTEGNLNVGRLHLRNNNQRTEPTQFQSDGPRQDHEMLVTDDIELVADQIRIEDSVVGGLGLNNRQGGADPIARVGDLVIEGCAEEAIDQQDGELVVRGGRFADNADPAVVVGDGTTTRIDDVSGFPTDASGSAEFEGGDGTRSITIDHGLAVTPTYVDAVADHSTDTPEVASVGNVTDTSFEVALKSAAPYRGDDSYAVYWDASVY